MILSFTIYKKMKLVSQVPYDQSSIYSHISRGLLVTREFCTNSSQNSQAKY